MDTTALKHNCVEYLCSLLKEIVGSEVYRAAEIRLRKSSQKPNDKDFQGTFERLMNDRFSLIKRLQESLADNFRSFKEGFLGFRIEFESQARYFKQKMSQSRQTEDVLNKRMEELQREVA